MKKALSLILALLTVSASAVACGGSNPPAPIDTDVTESADVTKDPVTEEIPDPFKQAYIHKISELNTEAVRDSHASEYATAGLESNFREYISLDESVLKTEVAFYPRVKQLSDGSFILFFQNGNHGPDIFYCLSADGFEYGEPHQLFTGDSYKIYSTCDAAVLKNGDILAVATYRTPNNYLQYPSVCGIALKRSKDNGKTWSDEQMIFRGCNWEPSVMQLESGEIQVYWTNTTGLRTSEGTFTSTGTAIVRSLDNGYTWSGDLNKSWSGQIVSQSKTEIVSGVQMFSDQMPVAVELHNGRIALALETRLDRASNFRITISHSDDNWATALTPFKDVGPDTKLKNYCIGAGPYIGQFESGETVISYNRKNNLTFRLGNDSADKFGNEHAPYAGRSTNYWGCFDILDTHSLVTASEHRTKKGTSEYNYIVSGRLYLNHLINARSVEIAADGDSKDWENNTDALFVGSVSQAQCSTRFAKDGDDLAVLCERLDYSRDPEGDTVSVTIAPKASSKFHYVITFCDSGIVELYRSENGSKTVLDAGKVAFAAKINRAESEKDGQAGYVAEMKVPLSLLDGLDGGFVCNIVLQNTDNGKRSQADMLPLAEGQRYNTWCKVRFSQ